MKGQTILGDIFVALFFLIMIIALIWIFFEHMPAQISSVREQKACAEAETMSKSLFETNGSDFISEPFLIKYDKFYAKNYSRILNDTNSKASSKIMYDIYAFNNFADNISKIEPNASANPSVYILRNGTDIIVRAGSNAKSTYFRLSLIFPFITLDSISVNDPTLADYRKISNYSQTTGSKVSEVYVNGTINHSDGRYSQINISLKKEIDIAYINNAVCVINNCSIYIGSNSSKVSGIIGPGIIYREKDFCTIQRRGVIKRGNETFSADIEIIAW